ncbi:MAG: hypothetical protein ACOZIN_06465 [Myxococcota bacterium]
MSAALADSSVRRPWLAVLLSLLSPGLGHLYAGELLRALGWAAAAVFLVPVIAWVWALAPFSTVVFLALCLAVLLGVYVGAAVWAYREAKARPAGAPRRPYQTLLAYVLFYLVAFFGGQLVTGLLRETVLDAVRVPSNRLAPVLLEGDWVLLRKVGDGAQPDPGEWAAFYLETPTLGPQPLVVGRVEKTPQGGLLPEGQYLGKVESVYFSVGPEGIRWSRIGLRPP